MSWWWGRDPASGIYFGNFGRDLATLTPFPDEAIRSRAGTQADSVPGPPLIPGS